MTPAQTLVRKALQRYMHAEEMYRLVQEGWTLYLARRIAARRVRRWFSD